MHRHEDVTATDELLVEVELGNGRPVGELFDAYEEEKGGNVLA